MHKGTKNPILSENSKGTNFVNGDEKFDSTKSQAPYQEPGSNVALSVPRQATLESYMQKNSPDEELKLRSLSQSNPKPEAKKLSSAPNPRQTAAQKRVEESAKETKDLAMQASDAQKKLEAMRKEKGSFANQREIAATLPERPPILEKDRASAPELLRSSAPAAPPADIQKSVVLNSAPQECRELSINNRPQISTDPAINPGPQIPEIAHGAMSNLVAEAKEESKAPSTNEPAVVPSGPCSTTLVKSNPDNFDFRSSDFDFLNKEIRSRRQAFKPIAPPSFVLSQLERRPRLRSVGAVEAYRSATLAAYLAEERAAQPMDVRTLFPPAPPPAPKEHQQPMSQPAPKPTQYEAQKKRYARKVAGVQQPQPKREPTQNDPSYNCGESRQPSARGNRRGGYPQRGRQRRGYQQQDYAQREYTQRGYQPRSYGRGYYQPRAELWLRLTLNDYYLERLYELLYRLGEEPSFTILDGGRGLLKVELCLYYRRSYYTVRNTSRRWIIYRVKQKPQNFAEGRQTLKKQLAKKPVEFPQPMRDLAREPQASTPAPKASARVGEKLDKKIWKESRCAGDGNCLFRAVATVIYGHESQHLRVRQEVYDHLVVHRDFFEAYVYDETYEEYLKKLGTNHNWGDDIELTACSEIYCKTLEIYRKESGDFHLSKTFHEELVGTGEHLKLIYSGSHYTAVVPNKQGFQRRGRPKQRGKRY